MLVLVDKMRVQQILINLISNGLKFSKRGDTILVKVEEPQHLQEHEFAIKIKVQDQGIGLSEEDR
jgi:signal transduction histidine kinase